MNGSSHSISSSVMAGLVPNEPISGQLLTLPASVLSKVNAHQPLSLRVNDQRLTIPPSCFITTPDGVKVFLPTGTLPPTVFSAENRATNLQLNVNKTNNNQALSLLDGDEKENVPDERKGTEPDVTAPTDTTCYLEKLQVGVDVLLRIFRYLPHCDLLR